MKLERNSEMPLVSTDNPHRLRREKRRQRVLRELGGRPTLAIEFFPVTILFGLQYGAMLVFPAIIHHTQPERLMLGVCGIGIGIAFTIESFMSWFPHREPGRPPVGVTFRSASVVLAVGVIAQVGLVTLGNVSYATQASGGARSHLAAIFTPLASWLMFGTIAVLWLWARGQVTRTTTWTVLSVSAGLQLALVIRTGLTASLAAFALAIVFVAVILRFIRLRWVVLAVALIPLIWPPLYNLRNDIRHTQVSTFNVAGQSPASERLREDLNFSHIQQLPEVPDPFISPSLYTEVQFGLIPRVVDPGREILRTAEEISVAEGSTINSAATLTTLGDAYALQGWFGVVLLVVPLTLAMGIAVRRRSPWSYMFLGILVTLSIWIESTYPDCLAAILQATVSLVAMGVLVTVVRFGQTRSPDANRSVDRRELATPEINHP